SLICLRSKYFSRTRTYGTVGAKPARPLVVLGAKREVACTDALRRSPDVLFDRRVVRSDLAHLAAPQVIEHKTRFAPTRQQPTARGRRVRPEVWRVGFDGRCWERGVGLKVLRPRVAMAQTPRSPPPACAGPPGRLVDPRLYRQRRRHSKWVRRV